MNRLLYKDFPYLSIPKLFDIASVYINDRLHQWVGIHRLLCKFHLAATHLNNALCKLDVGEQGFPISHSLLERDQDH